MGNWRADHNDGIHILSNGHIFSKNNYKFENSRRIFQLNSIRSRDGFSCIMAYGYQRRLLKEFVIGKQRQIEKQIFSW